MNEPSGTVQVVPVREEHIEGFNRAVDLVAREQKYLARTEAPPLTDSEAFVKDNIRCGNPHFVAVAGGRVVGWCDIVRSKREASFHCGVLGMGVVEGFRGRGVGSALMTAALSAAKAAGLERVELEVFHTNAPAMALYRKAGFREEGKKVRAARIAGRYLDSIQMALFLEDYEA